MCKFIGKSKERILCKLRKSEILRLHSIVHVAMETTKMSNLPVNQNLSSVYFSLAKFKLVSSNLSLAMIWQMTYTNKPPKLWNPGYQHTTQCSKTLPQIKATSAATSNSHCFGVFLDKCLIHTVFIPSCDRPISSFFIF